MYFFINFLTGVALSLDAFSLALIYGTVINKKGLFRIISLVVGVFHFFMPLFGFFLSNGLIVKYFSYTNILSFFIFFILGLEMIFSKDDNKNIINLSNFFNILLFAFTVSLDSFSIGIAISSKNESIIFPIIIFSITSFLFTYLGLLIGNKINSLFGRYASKIGGMILILLSFYYLFT